MIFLSEDNLIEWLNEDTKLLMLAAERLAKDRKKWKSCVEKYMQGTFGGFMQ